MEVGDEITEVSVAYNESSDKDRYDEEIMHEGKGDPAFTAKNF
jgi:hypothetical protein